VHRRANVPRACRGGEGAPTGAVDVLQGTLDRVVYANPESGWTVVRLQVPGRRETVTAVGSLPGVQPGERLRLTGRWVEDPKYGEQFHAETFTSLQPATLAGIQRYLGSGMVRGVGPRTAERLTARFGLETLEVIETAPERLVEVEGIGPVRASRIREAWGEHRAIRDIMVFLQGHGIPPSLAVRIFRRYGNAAVRVVREEPFRLADDVAGIGFRTADRLAARLGVPPDSPARIQAGIVFAAHRAAEEGHVHTPRAALVAAAVATLAEASTRGPAARPDPEGPDPPPVPAEAVEAELGALLASGRLVATADGESLALPALDTAERGVAESLARLLREPAAPLAVDLDRALAWYEERSGVRLAPQQVEAVAAALREPVLAVTGGPGTGKTTLLRCVVEIFARKGRRVLLCAPTGRAAQRLAEASGQEARTIHRLLEWDAREQRFRRDAAHPLQADLIVADECSMIDVVLMHRLCRAVPSGARLLLVGDADQLPSVGPGQVLADVLASGAVPAVRLQTVFRQAEESRIVRAAHRIREGAFPPASGGRDDFFFIRREDPEEILELCLRLVGSHIPRHFHLDPGDDVQVLTPMRRGLLGAGNLNARLQELLNPGGLPVRGGRGLRVGDRVLQAENDYERDVYNGDMGRVVAADEDEGTVTVRFGNRPVTYDARDLDALQLAYACSVHKAQGSEYPAVVIPLHTQHFMLLERRLLYTAVTRGRSVVVLVGSPRALGIALSDRRARPRRTDLARRLRAAAG
jgi:exodeoxyribonuclease V alpha subunit